MYSKEWAIDIWELQMHHYGTELGPDKVEDLKTYSFISTMTKDRYKDKEAVFTRCSMSDMLDTYKKTCMLKMITANMSEETARLITDFIFENLYRDLTEYKSSDEDEAGPISLYDSLSSYFPSTSDTNGDLYDFINELLADSCTCEEYVSAKQSGLDTSLTRLISSWIDIAITTLSGIVSSQRSDQCDFVLSPMILASPMGDEYPEDDGCVVLAYIPYTSEVL